MSKFLVEGGHVLNGEVAISGSKNAALPILCATLLIKGKVVLTNVPDIEDVKTTLDLLRHLGATVEFENNTATIDCSAVNSTDLMSEKARKMRASLLFAGPLLGRFGAVTLTMPGGCVIGKRPIDSHLNAFAKLGAVTTEEEQAIRVSAPQGLTGNKIIMSEISVTGTENAVMAAVLAQGTTHIRLAACEPHVEDLCRFLNQAGARIEGVGTHNLTINGVAQLNGEIEHTVVSDYLEAGTFLLAGILTGGTVTVTHFDPSHLDAFFQKLEEIGVRFDVGEDRTTVFPSEHLSALKKIESRTYPGFPTDLQAPFAVLLTQCEGITKIHETLFEGRLNYLFELEKMGARVEILNPHQAIVVGPTKLRGVPVASLDLRAGTATVLAALMAKGETEISNVLYIDRGYERFEEKLRALGAHIRRVE